MRPTNYGGFGNSKSVARLTSRPLDLRISSMRPSGSGAPAHSRLAGANPAVVSARPNWTVPFVSL